MNKFISLLLLAATLSLSAAQTNSLPVRGLAIAAPDKPQVDRFVTFIQEELAPRGVNTLILRVDYNYQFASRPEFAGPDNLSSNDVKKLVGVCHQNGIRLIPQINLLGHQSWAVTPGKLLHLHPELDETPWVKFPDKYTWPNPDRLYCKSYCPLHPQLHEILFPMIDELCDVFETDAFHAGMDEVFYLGEDKCPRCGGKDKAELFAGEVKALQSHLAEKKRTLWIWGDRLLDGKTTGLGEWEASLNGTHPAIDRIPRDVMICDWHYERAEPTPAYFAMKGFTVAACPWNNPTSAVLQVRDALRFREQSSPELKQRFAGVIQTVWNSAAAFMNELQAVKSGVQKPKDRSEAACFLATFAEINKVETPATAIERKTTRALVLAESGGQHAAYVDAARKWLARFASEHDFQFDFVADTRSINTASLEAYQLILQLNYPPYGWSPEAADAFKSYIETGRGGWVGFHHATLLGDFDGFKLWPWFSEFMGGIRYKNYIASFVSGEIKVEASQHPVMKGVPNVFSIAREEFYTYDRSPRPNVHVLAGVDEASYKPDSAIKMGGDHPVVWSNEKMKARNIYIFMGHGPDLFENPAYVTLFQNSILWATGREP